MESMKRFAIHIIFLGCLASTFGADCPAESVSAQVVPGEVVFYTSDELLTLECKAQPQQNITRVKWMLKNSDGTIVSVDAQKGPNIEISPNWKLQITVSALDEGHYYCEIETAEGLGLRAEGTQLRRAVLGRGIPNEAPHEYQVAVAGSIKIPCESAKSEPAATISWEKIASEFDVEGTSVSQDDRVQQGLDGTLYIRKAEAGDAGLYRCSAFNAHLDISTSSSMSEVFVSGEEQQYPPTLLDISPLSVKAVIGQTASFICAYGGSPLPEVEWTYPDVVDVSRINIRGSVLAIYDVQAADEGTYTCTVTSPMLETPITRISRLEVDGKPEKPKVSGGKTIKVPTMKCEFGDSTSFDDVNWFINTESISDHKDYHLSDEGKILTIKNNKAEGDLAVQCSVSNDYGSTISDAFVLNSETLKCMTSSESDSISSADALFASAFPGILTCINMMVLQMMVR